MIITSHTHTHYSTQTTPISTTPISTRPTTTSPPLHSYSRIPTTTQPLADTSKPLKRQRQTITERDHKNPSTNQDLTASWLRIRLHLGMGCWSL